MGKSGQSSLLLLFSFHFLKCIWLRTRISEYIIFKIIQEVSNLHPWNSFPLSLGGYVYCIPYLSSHFGGIPWISFAKVTYSAYFITNTSAAPINIRSSIKSSLIPHKTRILNVSLFNALCIHLWKLYWNLSTLSSKFSSSS